MVDLFHKLSIKNDKIVTNISKYLRENLALILILLAVAVAAYGFELFNLNLTIDEESAAVRGNEAEWNMLIGRWGKYFLGNILFPFPVIPFVPLFVALISQIGATLLLIESFEIKSKRDQIIIGVIGLSYPGMVFIYSFSTANYSIGIGLFCVALSLFLFAKNTGLKKFLALIPAVLAIGIYEVFIPALISVYILYIIFYWNKKSIKQMGIIYISMIIALSIFFAYVIQVLVHFIYHVPDYGYVGSLIDTNYLKENLPYVIKTLSGFLFDVYSGNQTIYGIGIGTIGVLLIVLGLGIIYKVLRSKERILGKLAVLFLLFIFILVPFLDGLFTGGQIPLRSLVGMPFILMGWVILGLNNQSNLYKSLVVILTIICVFQFISSSNHLFASSQMALEEDRVLGTQLIDRIEEAKDEAGSDNVQYLEIIGFVERPEIPLIPRIEVVGASFFGWDEGSSRRIVEFLKTLGYYDLEPLPTQYRINYVSITEKMPAWPEAGSVKVFGNVVVVKFGSYSTQQRWDICGSDNNSTQLQPQGFCP